MTKIFTYVFCILENSKPKCIHKSDADALPMSSQHDVYVLKWNVNSGVYESHRTINHETKT